MRFFRSKRGLAVLAAVLLALLLYRPGAYRLRNRIAGAIGNALGRSVTVDNVRLHLLPRPGFDLEGVVISDDPAFSAEPMVRAQEVTAAIRFRALLRGRIEVATLSANEPSINLVRSEAGRWNLANLLERSSVFPPARTPPMQPTPVFPYLEATHARVNFKIGQEKKAWSLTDADLALWQESDGSWGGRMAAQPMRTDVNLTDMGLIRLEAVWKRSPQAGQPPVQVTAAWKKGQLGQITKLFTGRDHGWRGDVTVNATLSGTPAALQGQSEIQIEDFRRYDIVNIGNVSVATICSGTYGLSDSKLDNLVCNSTSGESNVRVSGNARFAPGSPEYSLTLAMDKVPLSSALQLLRKSKKGVPEELAAAGLIDGEFHLTKLAEARTLSGSGTMTGIRLMQGSSKDQIAAPQVPFTVIRSAAERGSRRVAGMTNAEPVETHLRVGPFPLNVTGNPPLTAGGWLSSSEYRFYLRGENDVRNLYKLASIIGGPRFHPVVDGPARVDLNVSGAWQEFAQPTVSGTAQLHGSRAGVKGLNPPIDINAALVRFDADTFSLENLSAAVGKTRWTGTVKIPRHCGDSCLAKFDLAADHISTADLYEWFTPRPTKRPWYKILGADAQAKSPLLTSQAAGTLRIGRLTLKRVGCTEVATEVAINSGKITLSAVRAKILNGTHQGHWTIDAGAQPMQIHSSGTLQNLSLTQLGAAMGDAWVSGIADGRFDLTSSGSTFSEMLASANGELKFAMQNGAFAHLEIPEPAKPFPVHTFAARMAVKNGLWMLNAGRIESRDGIYEVSGTASPSGLNILVKRADEQSWNVTGTLLKPRLERATGTQARSVMQP